MNPTLILVTVTLWGASTAGAFFYGTRVGENGEKAKQASIEQAMEDTRKAAQEGAANAIAKIKINHSVIQGKTDTIIRSDPVYIDCRHSPDGVRLINEALTGRTGADGPGAVPGVNAVK